MYNFNRRHLSECEAGKDSFGQLMITCPKLNGLNEFCSACKNIPFCKNKRKAEDYDDCILHDIEASDENLITPVETPSLKLEQDGMVAQTPDVMLTANVDTGPDKLVKVITFNGAPERCNSLLESQLRNNKKWKDPRLRE
ncbi:hypothetical protein CHS0354_008385 [Potamilus streckersoni]|uniref:Uncharacterized protein n=1 Tax=Potamilus streckersoni TaxID=2493646 RepID=A0AAE0RPS9_9BIVA|nr:hypothetical protein CHS0354_008385 [Potamilus streckersoni]